LALSGMLPATDAALAELLRRLDTDTSADRFIGFLESWRNGPESFYQALDRTAGTEDSVFFYDAMLGDFVSMFAKAGQPGAKELRRGLDEAHDALHQAFLAYRQYRAFREAVALLLLLPPDRPLPARLQRYEQHVEGGYSIREQTLMLLAANDYDPRAVIDQLTAAAEPMPQPLWSQPYRTATTFAAVFAEAMPGMIDRAGDTDTFLQRATEQRQQLADEIAVVAAGALRQGASN